MGSGAPAYGSAAHTRAAIPPSRCRPFPRGLSLHSNGTTAAATTLPVGFIHCRTACPFSRPGPPRGGVLAGWLLPPPPNPLSFPHHLGRRRPAAAPSSPSSIPSGGVSGLRREVGAPSTGVPFCAAGAPFCVADRSSHLHGFPSWSSVPRPAAPRVHPACATGMPPVPSPAAPAAATAAARLVG